MHPQLCDATWSTDRPSPRGDYDGLSRRQAMRGLLRADRRARARVRLQQKRRTARTARYAWVRAAIGWLRGLQVREGL